MPNGRHRLDIAKLDKKVTALSDALANLGSADDFRKLLLIIRRPGWTTPAEYAFAVGMVDAMAGHAKALTQSKAALVKAASAVRS
jgi:hypothetical protein